MRRQLVGIGEVGGAAIGRARRLEEVVDLVRRLDRPRNRRAVRQKLARARGRVRDGERVERRSHRRRGRVWRLRRVRGRRRRGLRRLVERVVERERGERIVFRRRAEAALARPCSLVWALSSAAQRAPERPRSASAGRRVTVSPSSSEAGRWRARAGCGSQRGTEFDSRSSSGPSVSGESGTSPIIARSACATSWPGSVPTIERGSSDGAGEHRIGVVVEIGERQMGKPLFVAGLFRNPLGLFAVLEVAR